MFCVKDRWWFVICNLPNTPSKVSHTQLLLMYKRLCLLFFLPHIPNYKYIYAVIIRASHPLQIHTNNVSSFISLSRLWQLTVSCVESPNYRSMTNFWSLYVPVCSSSCRFPSLRLRLMHATIMKSHVSFRVCVCLIRFVL